MYFPKTLYVAFDQPDENEDGVLISGETPEEHGRQDETIVVGVYVKVGEVEVVNTTTVREAS